MPHAKPRECRDRVLQQIFDELLALLMAGADGRLGGFHCETGKTEFPTIPPLKHHERETNFKLAAFGAPPQKKKKKKKKKKQLRDPRAKDLCHGELMVRYKMTCCVSN